VQLAAGYLYHCPDLPVQHLHDAEGRPWTLLGAAVDVIDGRPTAEVVSTTPTGKMNALYDSLDGRWLLIGEHEVHGDLLYLIPVFYGRQGFASTPALLPGYEVPRPRLDIVDMLDWFPAPHSGVPGVRRLLPTQYLNLEDHSVGARDLPAQSMSTQESLDRMRRYLRHAVAGVQAERIVVPLTAGWDSRLVLAACLDAGVAVECVTLDHPGMSVADRQVPPQLAAAAGAPHRFVPYGPVDRAAGRLYDHQVGGHIREMDRHFMRRSQYAWTKPGDVLLRGVSLDTTRKHFHRYVLPPEQPDLDELRRRLKPTAVQMEGLRAYHEWTTGHPQPLPYDYLFDFEQGKSAWAAMSGVALDLTQANALQPGNTWAYLSAAMALPEEMRLRSEHHARVIDAIHPPLLDFPVNPPEPRWRPGRIRSAGLRRVALARRAVTLRAARTTAAGSA